MTSNMTDSDTANTVLVRQAVVTVDGVPRYVTVRPVASSRARTGDLPEYLVQIAENGRETVTVLDDEGIWDIVKVRSGTAYQWIQAMAECDRWVEVPSEWPEDNPATRPE